MTNTRWRQAVGAALIGLLLGTALAAPVSADNKRELLIAKIELQVLVGTADLKAHTDAILANIEEDFGMQVGPRG
jgi:hypothetical protein